MGDSTGSKNYEMEKCLNVKYIKKSNTPKELLNKYTSYPYDFV